MKHHNAFTLMLALGFLVGLPTPVFSDAGIDPREVAIDKILGGMKEGSRILSPQGTPGSHVGAVAETHHPAVSATPPRSSPAATAASHGVFVHGSSGGAPGLAGETTGGGPHEGAGANIGTETETLPGGETGAGGRETSVIEVHADANLETDSPSAGGDITITPEAGGGLLDANTETTTSTGSQEATSGASSDQNSMIEANAGADLSGGSPTVDAEVAIDPNASGGLVDAEAATSADLVEQELTSSAGLDIDNGATTTAAETTTVSSETGGTAVPATNEVGGGVEADVEGAGAGDDVECNPADGIVCPPKL